jgi:serine/threonine-protein kinase
MTNLIGHSLGRHHLLERLGEGGMATVYKAYDTRLEREVAVKVIRREAFPPQHLERILKRFEREAKVLASLTHPNIVKVLDSGEQDGTPYLVMEYIPSGTLKDRLSQHPGQPIPWKEAARLLAPVARALEHAHQHQAKIVHRDVKPSNILLTLNSTPMLSDFGIAKVLEGEETLELTGTGAGIGTPEYMAPEQATSKAVDHRADIYALGTVFYEIVTGRKPYQADTPMAVMIKKATEPLPRPTKLVPNLPDAVERILFKALAKNPADRYDDMGGFAEALEKLAEGRLPRTASLPAGSEPASVKPAGFKLRSGLVAALIVGGIGIAGVWIGFRTLNQPDGQNEAPAPTVEVTVEPSPVRAVDLSTSTPTPLPYVVPTPIDTMTSSKDRAELVYVPQGEFIMGSDPDEPYFWGAEMPRHNVYLNAFWIYRSEVTNAMYRACYDAGFCPRPEEVSSLTHESYFENEEYGDYPVIFVTHENASSYCKWAGERLPTEAEWEKAARGTDGRLFPWGNDELQSYHANFCDVGCDNPEPQEIESALDDGYRDVAPVGSFLAGTSPYGAWDMSGNVLEWVSDWYSEGYYSISPYENPAGPENGSRHPMRGGSWWSGRAGLRTSARASKSLNYSSEMVGFRCATDAPEVVE